MESRTKKNYTKVVGLNTETPTGQTRSSRNAKLYKHIYGEYEELDNLPLEDNTNEINMEKLRELVLNNNSPKENSQLKDDLNILEQRKRQIDEQKIYDINKILEKAKYENRKLKEPDKSIAKPQRDLLMTLGSTELSLDEINEAKKQYQEKMEKKRQEVVMEAELSVTKELKYKMSEPDDDTTENNQLIDTNSLSLDLFDNLKPTGDTIITKPIKPDDYDENYRKKDKMSDVKSDIHSGDTRDIDIIKEPPTLNQINKTTEFFTNAYEFSQKDFMDNLEEDDDFFDQPQKSGILKIIFLFLAIIIVIGVIIYFIYTYGLGNF